MKTNNIKLIGSLEEDLLLKRRFKVTKSFSKIIITGTVEINNNYYDGEMYFIILNKSFDIKIIIGKNKKKLPTIFETSNKVDRNYHKFKKGDLCLGSSIELWQGYIASNKSITKYIDDYIIPYFFRYCCIKDYGKAPIGEYSHGDGIREAYEDLLNIKDKKIIISIMNLYINNRNYLCPCGSGLKFRECHYSQIYSKLSKVPSKIIKNNMKTLNKIQNKKFYKKFV